MFHREMNGRKTTARVLGSVSLAVVLGLSVVAGAVAATKAKPGDKGASRMADVVNARQMLMEALEENMGAIEVGVAKKIGGLDYYKDRAYTISTAITAYPHLFPAGSEPGSPGAQKGDFDTLASTKVWSQYDDFYREAQQAAQRSYDLSQAKDMDEVAGLVKRVRATCDGCHLTFTVKRPDVKP